MKLSRRQLLQQGAVAAAGVWGFAQAQNAPNPANPSFHRLAAEYSAKNRGISLLVMVDGQVLFEDYPNRGSATRAHELASGTKSFCGVMAVAAQQDGLLNLDEAVAQTLPEWRSDGRSRITLRQLLSLTSGVPGGQIASPPPYAQAVATAATAEPGQAFSYGPIPFQVFGEVMRRKLNADPLDYLNRRIFQPIGLAYGAWRRGTDGNPHLPSGASLSASNWAKFGELVRLGGLWRGQRLLDAALLEQCFVGSAVNPIYGLTWWLNRPITAQQRRNMGRVAQAADLNPAIAPDLVMAAGAGDQRLYISQQLKLVVVRQADGILQALAGQRSDYSDQEFLSLLLTGQKTT